MLRMLFGGLTERFGNFAPVVLCLIAACCLAVAKLDTQIAKWVQYSAHYKTTYSSRDSSGNQTRQELQEEESRSADGALLTVGTNGGERTSAKLWQADGQVFSLDYQRRQAVPIAHSPRTHLPTPPQAPLGTKSISGLECTVYPVHVHDGSGNICIDFADDIILRQETHMNAGGLQQDIVREITSVDLNTPVNASGMSIPDGFTTLAPKTSK